MLPGCTATGGRCDGRRSRRWRIIAWGGVLAQVLLFVIALAVSSVIRPIHFEPLRDFLNSLLGSNLFMAVFNLIPIRPLDGHTAWRLKHLVRLRPRKKPMAKKPRRGRADKYRHVELIVDDALEEARSKMNPTDESSE